MVEFKNGGKELKKMQKKQVAFSFWGKDVFSWKELHGMDCQVKKIVSILPEGTFLIAIKECFL